MPTYMAIYGHGSLLNGQVMEDDTTDVLYFDHSSCMYRNLAKEGFETNEPAAVLIQPNPGTDEGLTVSFGAAPGADSPHHEYCPTCGVLVLHGYEDDDPTEGRTCDGLTCTWPEHVDPDDVI